MGIEKNENFFVSFMRLAGPFWSSKNRLAIRIETILLVVLTVMQIGMAVYVTNWNAALFDALEQRSMSGVKAQVGVLLLIFLGSIAITTAHLIVKRRLLIGWRTWLTEKVIGQWMAKGRHYQIAYVSQDGHDNPDGRIAEDIRIATEEAIALSHSLLYSVLMLGSFTKILWDLSGKVVFEFNAIAVPVSGYLVWISVSYAICASMLGWWMGRSMTTATHERQAKEADFRHKLIDLQANSQAIALLKGEAFEQESLLDSFQAIVKTYALQTSAWRKIQMFSSGYSVASMALPILVASPRYIAGATTLGMLIKSVQAFQHMVSALSWPVDNMAQIAKWRTSVERVVGLATVLSQVENDIARLNGHQIQVNKTQASALKLASVCLESAEGNPLTLTISDEIKAGEHVLIADGSGIGSKLFKAMVGLWPWGSGQIDIPDGETLFFMPSMPYLPSTTLFAAICYPQKTDAFDQTVVEKLLAQVGQKELAKQLNRADAWEQVLSNEQRQYLGFVRAVLHRPQWIFIQEALSTLNPDEETEMLAFLASQLPHAGILAISHRPVAETFYQHCLQI